MIDLSYCFIPCVHIIFIHSFIPLACAEFDDSLPFSGTSSIPLTYILFSVTLLHQLLFNPHSLHLAIYFLVLLIPNSYTILFWEFYFIPFSVHVQTNVIYVAHTSYLYMLLWWWWFNYCVCIYVTCLMSTGFLLVWVYETVQ
jgi:hypothetical protein